MNECTLGNLIGGNCGFQDLQLFILEFLSDDPSQLARISRVNKGINAMIKEMWKRIEKKLSYPMDNKLSHFGNYIKFIKRLFKVVQECPDCVTPQEVRKIKTQVIKIEDIFPVFANCPENQIPESVRAGRYQTLLKKIPRFEQVRTIQEFLKARDTLIVWVKLAKEARITVDFSNVMKPEKIMGIAALFSKWIKSNKKKLAAVEVLALNAKGLTSIPTELKYLDSLKKLDLRQNQITSIPEEVKALPNLQSLDTKGNPCEKINLEKVSK